MASCKDCLHYEACRHMLSYDVDPKFFDLSHAELDCPAFQNKTEYVKRERGEWHIHRDEGYLLGECPFCGGVWPASEVALWDFCPNCGADMRGDNNA